MGIDKEPNSQDKEKQKIAEQEKFITENYPFDESGYSPEKILDDAFLGFQVLEKRNEGTGELEGVLTYDFEEDSEEEKFCKIGILLFTEEERGMGLANDLFNKLVKIAKKEGCSYFTAKADTEAGQNFLENFGFEVRTDKATGDEYCHLDIE